jgi:hypothetical protein
MQLPGRLRGTTLGDLLGTLYRARASGVLELIETHAGRGHRVRLEQGLVTGVETAHEVPRLGELLLEQGELRASALVGLVRELGAGQVLSGRWLLERRLVSAEAVARALHEQQRLRLEPLFALEDCLVRFRVPRPEPRDAARPAPLEASEFLHGRPRARGNRSARRRPLSHGPWQVLGLTPDATLSDVKTAFRRLAAKSHPDRFPHASAEERGRLMRDFAELSCAYHALIA